jgi:hypothetical protein
MARTRNSLHDEPHASYSRWLDTGHEPALEIGHDDHGEDKPMLVHTFERELIHTDRALRFEQAATPRTPRAPRQPRYLADALIRRVAFWRGTGKVAPTPIVAAAPSPSVRDAPVATEPVATTRHEAA